MRFVFNMLLSLVILSGCNNKATSFLNTTNLKSQFISIDADSAYTLKTGKGSIIKINAGTFEVNNGQKINIEIKEAFSMQDILLAGLTTQSNGRPLRSAGMIYFNATSAGKPLDLKKPVDISIPSEIYDPAMQLFKGSLMEDSSVNWIDPQPLDTTPNAQMILNGEKLFKQLCSSCHKIFSNFTGPQLAGTNLRAPNKQWIYDFVANPAKMISKDPYAEKLFKYWQPTVMTSFPELTRYEIDAILAYNENQQRLYPDSLHYTLPSVTTGYGDSADYPEKNATAEIAPCYDTLFYPGELEEIVAQMPPSIAMPDTQTPAADMEFLRNGFIDPIFTEKMYDFSISTNGWYNVDAFVEGLEGSENITLNVRIENPYKAQMNLYLFCPDKKLLSVGVQKEDYQFEFDKFNGNIPLFLNDNAILLAFGSTNSQLYYGIKEFSLQRSQDISLSLSPITEDELKSMIQKNSIEGIELDIYKKEFEIRESPCITDTSR